jgi:steroid delta-isomerase-like uncharacterized protein
MADDNTAICRRLINDIVNRGNLDLADQLVGASYVYHGPGGLEMTGPQGYRQVIAMYRSAFPDLNMTIDDLLADGDKVAIRWTVRGTHKGDLGGIAPTGRSVTVTGLIVSRFSGGKLVEDFESFDEVSMLRQLGVTSLTAAAHV